MNCLEAGGERCDNCMGSEISIIEEDEERGRVVERDESLESEGVNRMRKMLKELKL